MSPRLARLIAELWNKHKFKRPNGSGMMFFEHFESAMIEAVPDWRHYPIEKPAQQIAIECWIVFRLGESTSRVLRAQWRAYYDQFDSKQIVWKFADEEGKDTIQQSSITHWMPIIRPELPS